MTPPPDLSPPCPCPSCCCRVADYVVLNKVDMMNAATLDSLQAIVASLNPLAQVCHVCNGGAVAAADC